MTMQGIHSGFSARCLNACIVCMSRYVSFVYFEKGGVVDVYRTEFMCRREMDVPSYTVEKSKKCRCKGLWTS